VDHTDPCEPGVRRASHAGGALRRAASGRRVPGRPGRAPDRPRRVPDSPAARATGLLPLARLACRRRDRTAPPATASGATGPPPVGGQDHRAG